MRRRELVVLLSATIMAPRALHAQQKAMPVIGYLASTSPNNIGFLSTLAAFRQGLGNRGYVGGQNVAIEFRFAEGRFDRLPGLAAELVGRKVDVILAAGDTTAAVAAKNVTSTIPIIFITGDDPVERHLVASLARPGGNLTGVSNFAVTLMAKRLELVLELVPQVKVVALISNPNDAKAESVIREAQEVARAKEVRLHVLNASTERDRHCLRHPCPTAGRRTDCRHRTVFD